MRQPMLEWFVALMETNNNEIKRLTVAIQLASIRVRCYPSHHLTHDLYRRQVAALDHALVVGRRIKQLVDAWEAAGHARLRHWG